VFRKGWSFEASFPFVITEEQEPFFSKPSRTSTTSSGKRRAAPPNWITPRVN